MNHFRYFILLAYNGTGFHGWQLQPNAITVQEVLQFALLKITGKSVLLTGAGRTDTGVHARCFYAHFDYDIELDSVNLIQLVHKLNRFIPESIVILEAFRVKPEIHARYSAISRTYHYYISRRKDPFSLDQAWKFTTALDLDSMNHAAEILKEYKDFTCFSKSHTQTYTNICTIEDSFFISENHFLIYHVKANRFLRNMVRAIVGTLIEVGKGSISIGQLREILEDGTRSDAGMSVPACGLFLEKIEYPSGIRLLP